MVCDECGCAFTHDEWGLFDGCPICFVANDNSSHDLEWWQLEEIADGFCEFYHNVLVNKDLNKAELNVEITDWAHRHCSHRDDFEDCVRMIEEELNLD